MIGEKYRWPTVVVLTLCLLGGFVRQVRSADLSPFLELRSLSGSFEQYVLDSTGIKLAESTGSFAILRPHFFRWTVATPGRSEVVVDGEYLWQYDVDLNTVSRSRLNPDVDLPLQLLLSDRASLEGRFDIVQIDSSVTLTPKYDGGLFETIQLVFENNIPVAINVADTVGQQIQIALKVAEPIELSASDFQFIVPEGADMATQN